MRAPWRDADEVTKVLLIREPEGNRVQLGLKTDNRILVACSTSEN